MGRRATTLGVALCAGKAKGIADTLSVAACKKTRPN